MKVKGRCIATQTNRKVPDFQCKLEASGHNVHIDPRTGERWGDGMLPRGMWRKWKNKKYNR
jgi:hypothetical protein